MTDIARSTAMMLQALGVLDDKPGPNNWDAITSADFSQDFDYIIERHGNRTVIDPTSKAALQWLYRHMPADCPRWGKWGYVIETMHVGEILERMAEDGLMSEDDYTFSMNAENRDRMADQ